MARVVNSQRGAVPPFYVMRVLEAAARRAEAGLDVLNLAAGQPSTPAPRPVRDEAARLLASGEPLGYTESLGIAPLREAIAGHYKSRYQLEVDRDDVVVTTAASGGFLLAFLAAFDAGDRVAMARPGYPAYRNILSALGCEVVELPAGLDTRHQPTVAMLEALEEKPDGLIVASPANPTGTMVTAAELADLATYCDANGIRLISDEIYHGISYGQPTACAWATSRDAVVVNSFSKYFSMTGWRLGWMLVPAELREPVDALAGNFAICPPTLPQRAAIAAFDSYAECDANVDRYRANRELVLNGLRGIGLDRLAPADGAFYVYADISHLTDDSVGFCRRLLDDTGVAIAPGIDFDTVDGMRTVRLSFAGSGDTLERAIERIGSWLPSAVDLLVVR